VLRLDGIDRDDPDRVVAAPEWATVELLEEAIRTVVERVSVASPNCEATGGPIQVRWGEQLAIRPIAAFEPGRELSDEAVAGYIAKYATQDAGCTRTVDRSLCCKACKGTGIEDPATGAECQRCHGSGSTQPLDQLKVPDHARRMILTCWDLGGLPALAKLRLRPWAHMLGFGGHFATKSRRYSTTLTALRNVRRDYQTGRTLHALGLDPDTTTLRRASIRRSPDDHGPGDGNLLVVGNTWYQVHDPPGDPDHPDDDTVLLLGHWRYAARGHSPGEALFARTIAQEIADNRRNALLAARHDDLREATR
jgi:hypothetical protein